MIVHSVLLLESISRYQSSFVSVIVWSFSQSILSSAFDLVCSNAKVANAVDFISQEADFVSPQQSVFRLSTNDDLQSEWRFDLCPIERRLKELPTIERMFGKRVILGYSF